MLNKAIAHGKEKRQEFRGAKAQCFACRNHGPCRYCERGRLFNGKKRLEAAKDKQNDVD